MGNGGSTASRGKSDLLLGVLQVIIRAPLTEIAYKAFTTTSRRARNQGLDVWEELNRIGFLATEPRIREIQKSTLDNLIARLEMLEPSELARIMSRSADPGTPTEMYRNIVAWIRNYATHLD